MFRSFKDTLRVVVLAAATLCLASTAEAGLLSRLAREAGDAAGSAGKHINTPKHLLDEGASIAKRLPKISGAASVALMPAPGNAWQLVTPEGKSLHLSSLNDLPDTLDDAARQSHRPLAGDLPGKTKAPATLQLAIRETDFFQLRDQLGSLPPKARPVMVLPNGKTYDLKPVRHPGGTRLAVALSPDVLIDPATARALDGNIRFLSRPVKQADLKMARFDSAASANAADPGDMIANLNADILASSLAKYKNRTLVVSGRIAPHPQTGRPQLSVRDGKSVRDIDLETFQAAAESQRVNLMLVDSASLVQPGKSWFSKTALEKRFEAAQSAMTQADLLKALSPPKSTTVISAADERNFRLVTATRFDPAATPAVATPDVSSAAGDDYTLAGWLLDASLRTGVRTIHSNNEDPVHTDEVESRWIPWVSNFNLFLFAVLSAVTLFLGWYLWRWWNRLWHFVLKNSAAAEAPSRLIKAIKIVLFVPFAFVMVVPAMIWLFVADWVRFLTWPFRKVFGR
ncbi:hypothetical protein [Roseibium aggregatum]|uniref:hypothetical protein n=1 Tax=Roseibium aggregatum TaxID=187304 RepID=UPI003A97CC66